MRRYVIGLIKHETNTFSPLPTPLSSFGQGEGPAFGEAARARFENTNTPMAAYLDLARRAHAEIVTRGVTATGIVEPELPLVLADRVQIQHVLLNLVLNSCESMSEIDAAARLLSLNVSAAGANVRFSVRDSGTGVDRGLIDTLFEPFVTTKPGGLGLGLSIARTVVDTHGGRIWAENLDGAGAMVSFLLPTVPAGGDAIQPPDIGSFSPSTMAAAAVE